MEIRLDLLKIKEEGQAVKSVDERNWGYEDKKNHRPNHALLICQKFFWIGYPPIIKQFKLPEEATL